MKHPRFRRFISSLIVLKDMQDSLGKFKLEDDNGFSDEFKKGLIDLFFEEGKRLRKTEAKNKEPTADNI